VYYYINRDRGLPSNRWYAFNGKKIVAQSVKLVCAVHGLPESLAWLREPATVLVTVYDSFYYCISLPLNCRLFIVLAEWSVICIWYHACYNPCHYNIPWCAYCDVTLCNLVFSRVQILKLLLKSFSSFIFVILGPEFLSTLFCENLNLWISC